MLYIIPTNSVSLAWHVGEPYPNDSLYNILASSPVVRFQADGDELDVILEAIRNASAPSSRAQSNLESSTKIG